MGGPAGPDRRASGRWRSSRARQQYDSPRLKVAFLLQDLQLSGGVGVVVEHARQLATRHGFDVTLAMTRRQEQPDWSFRGLHRLHVVPIERAREERYDVAVATWWETTSHLFDLDAGRHAYLVQSLEDRFYGRWDPMRVGAALTHALPVSFITEARWIAETLEELQPGGQVFYVRNGIDKGVFGPGPAVRPRLDGPLRILVEGYRGIGFKGVDDAVAAVGSMTEPRHLTAVIPDRASAGDVEADTVLGAVTQAELAGLYASTDVILKLSRIEGMFGPPLEGFHGGATCVVTPVTGHDEYVAHGWNGLVTEWDDTRGTGRLLDLLARDRRYLHFLRANALETARAWPSWEQSSNFMAAALRSIGRLPPPDPRAAGTLLASEAQAAAAAMGTEIAALERELTEYRWLKRRATFRALLRMAAVRHRRPFRSLLWPLRRLRGKRD
jgi:glycosyltransferase involved in cell wall biosynthesis